MIVKFVILIDFVLFCVVLKVVYVIYIIPIIFVKGLDSVFRKINILSEYPTSMRYVECPLHNPVTHHLLFNRCQSFTVLHATRP
jgi:hypothetical protein